MSVNHFISIRDLSKVELTALIESGQRFAEGDLKTRTSYHGKAIAQLFCENSTRTRVSFELAAIQLGLHVVNLDKQMSSMAKGESVVDTALTLEAMGFAALVMRHQEESVISEVAAHCHRMAIISAGAGTTEHPSQMILDAMTILQRKSRFEGLTVAIIGDIYHSRVAHSDIRGLSTLGVKTIRCIAPERGLPQPIAGVYLECFTKVDGHLEDVDVVIVLRVQQERIQAERLCDISTYIEQFQLTPARLATAKPDAIVMHPGPVNRGMEITSDVVDGQQSVILQQVNNGVFARMAIIDHILSK